MLRKSLVITGANLEVVFDAFKGCLPVLDSYIYFMFNEVRSRYSDEILTQTSKMEVHLLSDAFSGQCVLSDDECISVSSQSEKVIYCISDWLVQFYNSYVLL